MRPGIAAALERERPDWALVYGDTNSTLAGPRPPRTRACRSRTSRRASAAATSSMPEERNRIEVDRIAALLLCPDERSRATLLAEGVAGRIEVVGDVMADACFRLAPIARERSDVLRRFGLEPGGYVLATIHREANVQPERLAGSSTGFAGSRSRSFSRYIPGREPWRWRTGSPASACAPASRSVTWTWRHSPRRRA